MSIKTGTPTHLKGILGKITYTKEVINMISGLKRFGKSEVANQRLKIISFYDFHGEATTKEAFGVNRKTIYVWKKKLKTSKGKLISLIPNSTRPKRTRGMETNPKVLGLLKV